MSADVWAIVGVGAALAALIVPGQAAIPPDVVRFAERLARVEGVIEGWLNPPLPRPDAPK